ncbi:Na+/H+ antiporter [Brevibacillus fulvus]|uniref:CPA1 family monovalent cation:H+ antiporter n=1 Tax=Brevibacillus fulvus TaxID=1125967 RepID=A0A938XUV9_9BACL|nr:Na+/H+ antiporter [Brevibacillus fulvus]MBM7590542.1 CPA1 family monovalent cation:H+ antiporter [Brevibacillus fulvus]
MTLLMTVLVLLLCLMISNIISHYIPFIPTALTQIVFGMIVSLVAKNFTFEIETEWFLLLFVAPLLYNDGRYFPREELWKMRRAILGNAIVLVLVTTIGGGYFIHWMIPSIPLAAAFALAAILSPTDPVAVNGIAKQVHIPEKVLNLVRGESLINDASGLVAFNYAVAAVVTGYFSLKAAVVDFSYMFIVGLIAGLGLGILITWIRFLLRKQGIHDVTFHSLLHILTPFIIFLVAEEMLHASGVIAVVTAGVLHALVKEKTETLVAEEQVLTENIWSVVSFVLNGVVFLLLGLTIPHSMAEAVANPNIGNGLIIGYVLAFGIVILGIRFLWSYAFSYYEYRLAKIKCAEQPNLKTSLITSLTGVRGAVTMVGVLSIPLSKVNGEAFPERALILFLAAGVILFTLLAATIFLRLLSSRAAVAGDAASYMSIHEAKRKILLTAINKIREEINEKNEAAAYELMAEYKRKFHQFQPNEITAYSRPFQQKVTEIRLQALKVERAYLYELMEKKRLEEDVIAIFERWLDHREEALSNSVRQRTLFLLGLMKRAWGRFWFHYRKDKETRMANLRVSRGIQTKALQSALEFLQNHAKKAEEAEALNLVIVDYKRMIDQLKRTAAVYNEKSEEQKEELRLRVMDIERAEIHKMYENGEISRDQAKELRRFINYIESVALYEHVE